MPLESLGDPERINIKQFDEDNLETAPVLPFDPERDITEEDWGKIATYRNNLRTSSDSAASDNLLATDTWIKYLAPGFALGNTEAEVGAVQTDTQESFRADHAFNYSQCAMLKQLSPESFSEIFATAHETMFGELKRIIDSDRTLEIMNTSIFRAGRTLFPDQKAFFSLSEAEWVSALAKLNAEKDAFSYAIRAGNLRLLDDHRNRVSTTRERWQQLRHLQDQLRKNSRTEYGFLNLSYRMLILAAEEAYIDESGEVVIHMRKEGGGEFKKEPEPMPETRDF